MIIKVAASGYIPHLIFGAIGPLGLHDAGYTLELQMHPHWLVLEILVRDGPGAENISQYSAVCGWFHCQPEDTMLPPSQF